MKRTRQAAVVDIGSNSVRLVLYRLDDGALWTVFNEKIQAGLGRDLTSTGRLSVEGVERALAALGRFAILIKAARPDQVIVAATAAVREAQDGPAFRARVAAETGLSVRVLSGEEEAAFAARGVLAGIPDAEGVVGDLGGSSLELTRVAAGAAGQGITLPLGPFAMGEAVEAPRPLDPARARRRIAARLEAAQGFEAATLYAVGGAWRSLAQAHMNRIGYPLHVVHQYEIEARPALETARLVARQSPASLEKWPGLSRRRAETLPHAALVLEGLIERLGLERVVLSAWGVREGLLFQALRQPHDHDPLLAGCAALGRSLDVDPGLAPALEAWLAPLAPALPEAFGPRRDPVLTRAACRLADIGARSHPDHRVELAFDQVLYAPTPGQTHAERAFLACVVNARYGGPAATPRPEAVERLLPAPARRRAQALGLALRLGCDLSGRSPRLLARAALVVQDGALRLTAERGYAKSLLGEQARKGAKALAEALGTPLEAV